MIKAFLMVLVALTAFGQEQQAGKPKFNPKFLTFGVTELQDEDYKTYVDQLKAVLTDWLQKEAKNQPQEYSWEVLVKPSGWNKVSLQVSPFHIPAKFGGTSISTFTKVAKGSEDAKSVMEPVIKYIVELPKSLERSPYRKQ